MAYNICSLGDFLIMNPETIVIDLAPFMRVDFDAINELNTVMNHTKITTEKIAHDAIRNKQFIIGSFSPGTGVSFSYQPTVQYSAMQARAECRRLAKLYPGKTYFYAQLYGAEMTVPQPQTVSI
jgi:hypothetical protein